MPSGRGRGKPLQPRGKCRQGCEWLQVSDSLWLCPHGAYGEATSYRGAVEEARRMLERAGGYEALIEKVRRERAKKQQKKRKDEASSRARVVYGA